jgi:hypothetical protein
MTQTEVNALFQRLGVTRWDTFPPAAGLIVWYDGAGQKVAWGKYRVILSYGPGTEFTMAWAVDVFRGAGIPAVERQGDDPAKSFLATEAQAWEKALAVAQQVRAQFAYKCATAYVAVTDFEVANQAMAAPITVAPPPARKKTAPPVTAAPKKKPVAAAPKKKPAAAPAAAKKKPVAAAAAKKKPAPRSPGSKR